MRSSSTATTGGAFRFAIDDSAVHDIDPELDQLLVELCGVCEPHCSETQYLTALVDMDSFKITKMNLEDAPE